MQGTNGVLREKLIIVNTKLKNRVTLGLYLYLVDDLIIRSFFFFLDGNAPF